MRAVGVRPARITTFLLRVAAFWKRRIPRHSAAEVLLVSDPVPSRSFDGGSCHVIANSERVSPDGFRKISYSLLERQGIGKRKGVSSGSGRTEAGASPTACFFLDLRGQAR